ncbi:MAG: hypothetical protein GX495_05400 [Chloroflexi bacterium]|jgi:hypothetical protein|nr:hypothetical protein [Chloroflexota bacterium]
MKKRTRCPVLSTSRQVLNQSLELRRSMRRLRRSLQACGRCSHHGACRIIEAFNSQIHAAILEINDEWGLL